MSDPKKHHYLPAGLLSGFTLDGGRDGRLMVFDLGKHQWRSSKPGNEATRKNYYKLEKHSGDPLEVEKLLGKTLEADAANVIREIEKSSTLPGKEGMENLISFVGLLATRVPAHRNRINGFFDTMSRKLMSVVLADKARYENTIKRALAAGDIEKNDVTYEDMKKFHSKGAYTVEVDQDYLVGNMLTMASQIVDLLYKRNWRLLVAAGDEEFVIGENPVALTWTNPSNKGWMSPGFGLLGTEVLVPISRKHALIGTFEGEHWKSYEINARGVAVMNNRQLERTQRWIYASREQISWIDLSGKMSTADELPIHKIE